MKIVIAIILIFSFIPAKSCECLTATFEEEIQRAEKIFVGEVVEINNYKFTFRIIVEWNSKVQVRDSAIIIAEQGKTSCTKRTFKLNEIYLVYLSNGEVENCSRTKEFQNTNDIERIDKLKAKRRIYYDSSDVEFDELNYKRIFVIKSDDGNIDIKNKKVVFIQNNKIVKKEETTTDKFHLYKKEKFRNVDYIFIAKTESKSKKNKLKRKLRKRIKKEASR